MSKNEKFFTERDRTLFKVFILVFLFFVLLINWSEISGVLNFRVFPQYLEERVGGLLSFFEEEEEVVRESEDNEEEKEARAEPDFDSCEGEDRITIPALDVEAPIVETGGTSEEEYRAALEEGVVRFPGGKDPGEKGLSVISGHSAPPGHPDIRYERVFTRINELEEGDIIETCYDNKLYSYEVIDEERGREVYEVGEDIPPLYPEKEVRELVLMTCWPPGDDQNRMGVRAIIEE